MHQLLLLKQKGLTLMDAAKQNLGYDPVALGERIAHIRKANNHANNIEPDTRFCLGYSHR